MSASRVLYIDDELDLLDLASSFFEDENLPIDTTSDFHQALELIRKNHYDLIISDAKMPSGSGYDLISIIRKEDGYTGKIILVTGNAERQGDAKTFGYDLLMSKPVQFQKLVDTAKEMLSF
ncbi:MAG TPA: response regulator [Bacteriovoracaceae bacterium]|nr:response regulator [Bacteriovoracaceae bacterium]